MTKTVCSADYGWRVRPYRFMMLVIYQLPITNYQLPITHYQIRDLQKSRTYS
ncbi:MAG: hypothetical protein HC849_03050 [Oscillatoriales cyanobacterium RU_3_3]|nr:hypothetical protein [Microcoleus sp. SU_5_3]NJL68583.1 hypothetical protein [Microcoleus sp. SM1_3_4]NJM59399.1 hypothetical protein [Oscillatoriales cyanobacterium RU_3_3]NJR21428.1 hypothetical protein [Richelia sp. CSU_2_1]